MASSVIAPVSAGKGTTELLEGQFGRRAGDEAVSVELPKEFTDPKLVETAGGIEQDAALRRQLGDEIDLVEQPDVLNHEGVGLYHRLSRTDRALIDAAIRHDRGAHALVPKAQKRLRMATFGARRDREDLGRGHHAVAVSPWMRTWNMPS